MVMYEFIILVVAFIAWAILDTKEERKVKRDIKEILRKPNDVDCIFREMGYERKK